MIPHRQIFDDKEDLPTFNSHAIELYLHKIPGLSNKFLYFNDDTLLANTLSKEDLCCGTNGQKIYISTSQANQCAEGCANKWLGDGKCQPVCNNHECLYDNGDCSFSNPDVDNVSFVQDPPNFWMSTLVTWNIKFNQAYGFGIRYYPMHQAILIDKHVKEAFNIKYGDEVIKTAMNRFRDTKDVQLQFTYIHFLMETQKKLMQVLIDVGARFQDHVPYIGPLSSYQYSTLREKGRHLYIGIEGDVAEISRELSKLHEINSEKFVCIQDLTNDLDPKSQEELQNVVVSHLERKYPLKSRFEI